LLLRSGKQHISVSLKLFSFAAGRAGILRVATVMVASGRIAAATDEQRRLYSPPHAVSQKTCLGLLGLSSAFKPDDTRAYEYSLVCGEPIAAAAAPAAGRAGILRVATVMAASGRIAAATDEQRRLYSPPHAVSQKTCLGLLGLSSAFKPDDTRAA